MKVLRIVPNVRAASVEDVKRFYAALFDMDVVMDLGWIATLSSGEKAAAQLSIASEGGSGQDVPDISIEVSDVDEAYRRAKGLSATIVYDMTDEPWGVRRFFVVDPTGRVLNVLSHSRD